MSVDREHMRKLFGTEVPETPETIGYGLSTDYATQVLLETERRGLKMKDLANAMGVTSAAVSSMLKSSSNMTMKTVAKLAMALGLGVEAPRLTAEVEGQADKVISLSGSARATGPRHLDAAANQYRVKVTVREKGNDSCAWNSENQVTVECRSAAR